ncbi:MAG: hypothetical protein AAF939_10820 [Planctomycetota bacterium]
MSVPDGFITRIEAQSHYQRSKQSFIRDVDQARLRGDSAFLENFVVVLKDDSVVQGKDATKKFLHDNDSLKPEWYIRKSFLDTRYWVRGKARKSKKASSSEPEKNTPNASQAYDPYVALLEKTNEELRNQNAKQLDLIAELTENQKQSNVLLKSFTDRLAEPKESLQLLDSKLAPRNKNEVPERGTTAAVRHVDSAKESSDTLKPFWKRDIFWFINDRL